MGALFEWTATNPNHKNNTWSFPIPFYPHINLDCFLIELNRRVSLLLQLFNCLHLPHCGYLRCNMINEEECHREGRDTHLARKICSTTSTERVSSCSGPPPLDAVAPEDGPCSSDCGCGSAVRAITLGIAGLCITRNGLWQQDVSGWQE